MAIPTCLVVCRTVSPQTYDGALPQFKYTIRLTDVDVSAWTESSVAGLMEPQQNIPDIV